MKTIIMVIITVFLLTACGGPYGQGESYAEQHFAAGGPSTDAQLVTELHRRAHASGDYTGFIDGFFDTGKRIMIERVQRMNDGVSATPVLGEPIDVKSLGQTMESLREHLHGLESLDP